MKGIEWIYARIFTCGYLSALCFLTLVFGYSQGGAITAFLGSIGFTLSLYRIAHKKTSSR